MRKVERAAERLAGLGAVVGGPERSAKIDQASSKLQARRRALQLCDRGPQAIKVDRVVQERADAQGAADSPGLTAAFGEAKLLDNPGFDVIVGNPPWEEVTVEELAFYARPALGFDRCQRPSDVRRWRS